MTTNPYYMYIIKLHIVKYRLSVVAKGVNVSQLAEVANPGELNHIDLQSFLRSVSTYITFNYVHVQTQATLQGANKMRNFDGIVTIQVISPYQSL